MIPFFHIIIIILLIGLFFYTKLLPYRLRIHPDYTSLFNFFDAIFSSVLRLLRKVFKPLIVGQNLSVDTAQLVLFIILLLLLQIY